MSTRTKAINNVAAAPFKRPDAARIFRNTVMTMVSIGVIVWAALSLTGPLSWLLWAISAYRVLCLCFIGVASAAIEERMRRLEAIPPSCLEYLRTGGLRL